MQVVRFECPYCSADLKMRSDEFVGRTVGCPECRKPILLRRGETGTLVIERGERPPELKKKAPRTPVVNVKSNSEVPSQHTASGDSESNKAWRLSSRRFQGIAAGAIGAAVLLGGFAYFLWSRSAGTRTGVPIQAEIVQGSPAAGPSKRPGPAAARPRTDGLPPNFPAVKSSLAIGAAGLTMPRPGKPSGSGSVHLPVAGGASSQLVQSSAAPAATHAPASSQPITGSKSPTAPQNGKKLVSRLPVEAPRPVVKDAPPIVDITAGLRLRFAQFEQPKPVPLKDVLDMLQEILAVPIRSDKHEIADLDDLLQTPVTFNLRNTTTEAVLRTVLDKANLRFEVERDAIRLRKASESSGNAKSRNETSDNGTPTNGDSAKEAAH